MSKGKLIILLCLVMMLGGCKVDRTESDELETMSLNQNAINIWVLDYFTRNGFEEITVDDQDVFLAMSGPTGFNVAFYGSDMENVSLVEAYYPLVNRRNDLINSSFLRHLYIGIGNDDIEFTRSTSNWLAESFKKHGTLYAGGEMVESIILYNKELLLSVDEEFIRTYVLHSREPSTDDLLDPNDETYIDDTKSVIAKNLTDEELKSIVIQAEDNYLSCIMNYEDDPINWYIDDEYTLSPKTEELNTYEKIENYLSPYWSENAINDIINDWIIEKNGVLYMYVGDPGPGLNYEEGEIIDKVEIDNILNFKIKANTYYDEEAMIDSYTLIREKEKWVIQDATFSARGVKDITGSGGMKSEK